RLCVLRRNDPLDKIEGGDPLSDQRRQVFRRIVYRRKQLLGRGRQRRDLVVRQIGLDQPYRGPGIEIELDHLRTGDEARALETGAQSLVDQALQPGGTEGCRRRIFLDDIRPDVDYDGDLKGSLCRIVAYA